MITLAQTAFISLIYLALNIGCQSLADRQGAEPKAAAGTSNGRKSARLANHFLNSCWPEGPEAVAKSCVEKWGVDVAASGGGGMAGEPTGRIIGRCASGYQLANSPCPISDRLLGQCEVTEADGLRKTFYYRAPGPDARTTALEDARQAEAACHDGRWIGAGPLKIAA